MRYRVLGNSDLKVSTIGIGTGQFGSAAWGYGVKYKDDQILEIVRKGMEDGLNLIDTAETYGDGKSEALIGAAIEGRRDDFVIATKVAPWNLGYKNTLKAATRSLKRLRAKTIDLYQIHFPNPFMPLKETMRAMETLIREDKIRYIGVSNFSVRLIKKAQDCLRDSEIVSNEIEYNLFSRKAEGNMIPYCKERGMGVIAYSPLAGGLLTGKFRASDRPRDRAHAFNFWNHPRQLRKAERLLDTLAEIAMEKGASVPQVALGGIIRNPGCVAIPAPLSYGEMQDNVGASNLVLTDSDMNRINDTRVNLDLFSELMLYIVKRISWTKEALRHSIKDSEILNQKVEF